jgi:hypothetical protein
MEIQENEWAQRFGLTHCAAADINQKLPPDALGVAVVYAEDADGQSVFLVIESRARGLRAQLSRRLETAKFPAGVALQVAFRVEAPTPVTPEEVHAACREQVILAGALRRELRPAMR